MLHNNVPSYPFTWLGAGGILGRVFYPHSLQELQDFIHLHHMYAPFYIIGNGTNTLLPDTLAYGTLIAMKHMKNIHHEWIDDSMCSVEVEAGCSCKELSFHAYKNSLGGLEFFCGIPGSVGGAAYMNAGCCSSETYNYLTYVKCMHIDTGDIIIFSKKDIQYSYRTTTFQFHRFVILTVIFSLCKKKSGDIKNNMKEVMRYKSLAQPQGIRTAGSTFRNYINSSGITISAWKIIRDAVDDNYLFHNPLISFSKHHSNFLVCKEKTVSSHDIKHFIAVVQKRVYDATSILLQREICYLG